MAEKAPAFPQALLPMIVGRGTFAEVWKHAGKMNAMGAVADVLAAKGWSETDIVGALCNHPDRDVGVEEATALARTASKNVPRRQVQEREREEPKIVRVMCQRPRTYDVDFAGETFTVGTAAVASRNAFRMACLDNTASVPSLPPAKVFDSWLEAQLGAAERVEQPPEASAEGMELAFVESVIASLRHGDAVSEIAERRIVTEGGYRYIHASVIYLNHIRLDMPSITPGKFTAILRKLGWLPHAYQGENFRSRAWREPQDGPVPESWAAKMAKERAEANARESAAVQRQYAQIDKGMFE